MRKNLILVTVLVLFVFNGFGQTIKTFKGELNGGTITYDYYENSNSEMVRNGKFLYSKKEAGFSKIIKGSFKEGKRTGSWSYSINLNNYETDNNTSYSGWKKLTMSYLNGLPNGLCIYSGSLKVRHKKYINGLMQWGSYDKSTITKIYMNFKNGILAGKFSINDGFSKEIHTGNFNKNSFADGNFISIDNYAQTKTTATYLNGVITKFNKINTRTGKVEYSLSQDPALKKIHNDFANGILSVEDLEEKGYKADTVHSIASISSAIKSYIYADEFLFYEIGGDLIYNFGDVKYGGNKAITFIRVDYIDLDNETYKRANDYFEKGDFQSALNNYEEVLTLGNIRKKDYKILNDKINLCKVKVEQQKEIERQKRIEKEHLQKKQYQETIKTADDLFSKNEFQKALEKYKIASDIMPSEQYPSDKINEIKRKLNNEEARFNRLLNDYNKKKTDVKDLYIVKDEIKSQVLKQTVYKTRKKRLYNAYLLILNDYDAKLKNTNNVFKKNVILEDGLKLLDKMVEFSSLNTKSIEKELKGKTDIQEIKKILSL